MQNPPNIVKTPSYLATFQLINLTLKEVLKNKIKSHPISSHPNFSQKVMALHLSSLRIWKLLSYDPNSPFLFHVLNHYLIKKKKKQTPTQLISVRQRKDTGIQFVKIQRKSSDPEDSIEALRQYRVPEQPNERYDQKNKVSMFLECWPTWLDPCWISGHRESGQPCRYVTAAFPHGGLGGIYFCWHPGHASVRMFLAVGLVICIKLRKSLRGGHLS